MAARPDLVFNQREAPNGSSGPTQAKAKPSHSLLREAATGKSRKREALQIRAPLSAVSSPDRTLKLHLHCPLQYPSLPCQQLVTRCLPSGLLPASSALVVLALPVSCVTRERKDSGHWASNGNKKLPLKFIFTSKP